MIANAVWQSRLSKQNTPRSDSSQPKNRNYLILQPQFFLPILHHTGLGIEKLFSIPPKDNTDAPLIDSETTSEVGSPNQFLTMVGKLQNHVVVAFVTSCCQVYGIVAYFMYLIRPVG